MPQRYLRRPETVKAMRWLGNTDAILAFAQEARPYWHVTGIFLHGLTKGGCWASPGDYILRRGPGDFYAMRPVHFEAEFIPLPPPKLLLHVTAEDILAAAAKD